MRILLAAIHSKSLEPCYDICMLLLFHKQYKATCVLDSQRKELNFFSGEALTCLW